MACAVRPMFVLVSLAIAIHTGWTAPLSNNGTTHWEFPEGVHLIAVGGWNGEELDDVDIISISGNSHTSGAAMPNKLHDFGSTLVNNTIYVVGGIAPSGPVSSFLAYDVASNNWTKLRDFPFNVSGNVAVAWNGSIFSLGGEAFKDGFMNYTYTYDVNTRIWWKIPTLLPFAQTYPCAVADQSSIYYIVDSGAMYRSNDGARTWKKLSAMSQKRYYTSCTFLQSGSILVAGGGLGAAPFNSAELYNIAADTWTSVESMTTGRQSASAVSIPGTDDVVVCGGFDRITRTVYSDCELYSSSKNQWRFTDFTLNMPREHYGLFATNK